MPQSTLCKAPTLELQQSLLLITDYNGLNHWKTRRDTKKLLYEVYPDCKGEIRKAFYKGRVKSKEPEKEHNIEEFCAYLSKYCRVLRPEEINEIAFSISQLKKNTLYAKLPSSLGIDGYVSLQSYIEDYWKVFHNALMLKLIQLGAKRIEFHFKEDTEHAFGIKAEAKFEKDGGGFKCSRKEINQESVIHIIELERPTVPKHQVKSNFSQLDINSTGAEILIDGFLVVRERAYGGKQKLVINIKRQIEKHLGFSLFARLLKFSGEGNSKREEFFNCTIDVAFFSEDDYEDAQR